MFITFSICSKYQFNFADFKYVIINKKGACMNNDDYEYLKRILYKKEQEKIDLVQNNYENIQSQLQNIQFQYNLQMNLLNQELNNIINQYYNNKNEITNSFCFIEQQITCNNNFKMNNVQKNQLFNNYYPNKQPNSELGKLIFEVIKEITYNIVISNTEKQNKEDIKLCKDIIDLYSSSKALLNPLSSDIDKGIAIVKLAELLNKYFS